MFKLITKLLIVGFLIGFYVRPADHHAQQRGSNQHSSGASHTNEHQNHNNNGGHEHHGHNYGVGGIIHNAGSSCETLLTNGSGQPCTVIVILDNGSEIALGTLAPGEVRPLTYPSGITRFIINGSRCFPPSRRGGPLLIDTSFNIR